MAAAGQRQGGLRPWEAPILGRSTQSGMRQRLFIAGGLWLAAALAAAGQALFGAQAPLPLSRDFAWLLAAVFTLAAMALTAFLAPPREDDPGLQPHPRSLSEPAPASEPAPVPGLLEASVNVDPSAALNGVGGPEATFPLSPVRPAALSKEGQAWQALRLAGTALAVALAYLGILIFQRKPPFLNWPEARLLITGSAATAVGMALFGLLGPRPEPEQAVGELPAQERPALAPLLAEPWFLGWLALALGLYGYTMGYYQGAGETRAVVGGWIASMIALLVAVARPRPGRPWRPRLPSRTEALWGLALVGVLAAAFVLRTVRLTTLPYDLDGDFASYGIQARALVTGQETRLFTVGWANIPMIGYLPPALTMFLFGTGQVGLNMSGVIGGMLSLIGTYLLGRDLFGRRVALLATAISSVLYVHVHFSRVAAYMDPLPFMVFGLCFLMKGLRWGRGWPFAVSGLLFAFGFMMYYSGRAMFVVAALWLVYLAVLRPRWLAARWQGLLLAAVGFLLAMGPMLIFFIRNQESLVERSRAVFLFYPPVVEHLFGKYNVTTMSALVWEQFKRTLLMFHYYIDTSTQFGMPRPFLDPYTAPLLALGVGYALFRLRRQAYAFVLLWLSVVLIIGCMLTSNAPFWPRLVVLLPPVALLIALAVDLLVRPVEAWLRSRVGPASQVGVVVFLVAGLAFIGYANWREYDRYKGSWATSRTLIARYMAAQGPAVEAWMISDPFSYRDREFEFLVPGRFLGDLTREQVLSGSLPDFSGPGLIIITPNHADLIPILEKRYPHGITITHPGNSPAEKAFYAFKVSAGGD